MPSLPSGNIDTIEYLVRRKFPVPLNEMIMKYGNLPDVGLTTVGEPLEGQELAEHTYRMELLTMPEDERLKLFEQERLKQQNEASDRMKLAAELEELRRPYNHGDAITPDYAYWAKMGTWEWDEVTALSLGRDPMVVNPRLLENSRYRDSPFVKEYAKRRELIRRSALWAGTIVTSPADFYDWAQKYQVELPMGLVEQLETFANPVDWKKAYTALDKKRAELEARIQQLEKTPPDKPEKKGPLTRERNTLVRLVYGMAREGYRWADDGKKASPASRIVRDMEQFGRISEDTVGKYLKEGKEITE